MTTFVPRPPYSDAELKKLYPENLELKLVQVLLRHGERTPVSPRFQNVRAAPKREEKRLLMNSGRPTEILALLQCGQEADLGRHDHERRFSMGKLAMEEKAGERGR